MREETMSENQLSLALSSELLRAARIVEKNVDEELDKLEGISSLTSEKFKEEVENLRSQRLQALRNEAAERKQFLMKGHGVYDELASVKEFFSTTEKSERVVVHFYIDSNEKCRVIDEVLKQVCSRHLETRFTKINMKSCKFLRESLNINVPTIIMVMNNFTKGRITNFDDVEDITINNVLLLEWKIAKFGVIKYEGDLSEPAFKKKGVKKTVTRSIRGRNDDDDDSDIE